VKRRVLTTRQVVLAGLLAALIVALSMTPLGLVPVPTPAGQATILHIPVIVGAVLEGPLFGSLLGLVFGLASLWIAYTAPPNPIAQVIFCDPFTAIAPRVLIGLLAALAYRAVRARRGRGAVVTALGLLTWDLIYRVGLQAGWYAPSLPVYLAFLPVGLLAGWGCWRLLRGKEAPVAAAGLVGSLTNTVGVLGLVVLRGILPPQAAAVIGVVQGFPEAALAVVLTILVYNGVRRFHPEERELAAGPRRGQHQHNAGPL